MIEKELKIREVSGDYALDIPFADGSVNTIYFNSKRNAETVKHIIEVDGYFGDVTDVDRHNHRFHLFAVASGHNHRAVEFSFFWGERCFNCAEAVFVGEFDIEIKERL